MLARFGIGTQFIPIGNRARSVYTVTDIYTTINVRGIPIKIQYVCEHGFCGQKIESTECEATIARGICNMQDLIEKGKLS